MIPDVQPVPISDSVSIGGKQTLTFIAGPCVIEDRGQCLQTAAFLAECADRLNSQLIFKASFDKANRSSVNSFRGPGMDKGLDILSQIKTDLDIPVTTDIHLPSQAEPVSKAVDLIQIPAFLCRQTDLIQAAAKTGKPLNIKKGQFLSPEEIENIVEKASSFNAAGVCITERGTSFGYNRLVNDFTGFPVIRSLGIPLIFDATHSVQRPGGNKTSSGGKREFVPVLARAAAGAGIDALFFETHPDPEQAKSDGPNMVPLSEVEHLMGQVIAINSGVRQQHS